MKMKNFVSISVSIAMIISVTTACFAESDEEWKNNTGTISLDKMSVTGDGISVNGNTILISGGGDFTVTGTQSDGMILINTDEKVKLRLSGISLTNPSGPAIFFENTEKGFITITENTENFLSDSAEYSIDDADAALFSNDDLEIKGDGTLTINGNYKHGIASDDDLSVENGIITVISQEHGLKANNSVNIIGGTFNITSKTGKGIKAGETLTIDAGTINIVSEQGEGMESKGTMTINGGDISVTAADDGLNTGSESNQTGSESLMERPQRDTNGNPPQMPDMNNEYGNPPEKPNRDFDKSTQPMRGGGVGGFGKMDEETEAAHALTINGGNIYINSGGDGIDSNGSLSISGGKIIIDGPESSGNGPIDSDGTMTITGGEIISLSSAGMIQLPQGQAQNILKVFFDSQGAVGDEITIKDDAGNGIMAYTASKRYSALIYSSPELTAGTNYSIYRNNELFETAMISEGITTVGTMQKQMSDSGRFGNRNGKQQNNYGITVSLDNQNIRFDTNPIIKNDTTLVGFRAILEAMGAEVSWDEETQTVTAIKNGISIALTINSETALVNGSEKTLLTPPEIIDGSTMIPVRFISEQLGMTVDWDSAAQHISITSK